MTTPSRSHAGAPITPARAQPLALSPTDSLHVTPRDDAKIYVLSADGTSLYLLDPSQPHENEEPPPYGAFHAHLSSPSPTRIAVHGIEDARSPPSRLEFTRLHSSASLNVIPRGSVFGDAAGPSRSRASTFSTSARSSRNLETSHPRIRGTHSDGLAQVGSDERTSLLGESPDVMLGTSRGLVRSILCGDIASAEVLSWGGGFKRFWAPIGRSEYWLCLVHLVLLNFPFALAVWLPLLLGTLVGTALLITLPIGAAIWWLTLFITRSAARGEIRLQTHYHSPGSTLTPPIARPIFYRFKAISSPGDEQTIGQASEVEMVLDKRFFACSYAMFMDHYSYSALSYFLIVKPLLTISSFLLCVVLVPVGAATILGLPIVLRGMRRWGRWQAGIAMENLS